MAGVDFVDDREGATYLDVQYTFATYSTIALMGAKKMGGLLGNPRMLYWGKGLVSWGAPDIFQKI